MTDGSDQGPHYIPELDPDNPESGPKAKQPIMWFLLIAGLSLLFAGAFAFMSGHERFGLILGGIGLLLLAPFTPGIGWP
jgi:hypothetical protein